MNCRQIYLFNLRCDMNLNCRQIYLTVKIAPRGRKI